MAGRKQLISLVHYWISKVKPKVTEATVLWLPMDTDVLLANWHPNDAAEEPTVGEETRACNMKMKNLRSWFVAFRPNFAVNNIIPSLCKWLIRTQMLLCVLLFSDVVMWLIFCVLWCCSPSLLLLIVCGDLLEIDKVNY